jgi:hypothetical protein
MPKCFDAPHIGTTSPILFPTPKSFFDFLNDPKLPKVVPPCTQINIPNVGSIKKKGGWLE